MIGYPFSSALPCSNILVALAVFAWPLLAVPPVDFEPAGENNLEAVWENTGEDVRLEGSDDVGINDPWLPLPGEPDLEGGFFRQLIDIRGLIRGFYRLAEVAVDPTAPVFDNPPPAGKPSSPASRSASPYRPPILTNCR